jgi:hypothetical protein
VTVGSEHTEPRLTVDALARLFHETYERLAPSFGWETQERSRRDWDDVPAENKALMVAVASEVIDALRLDALWAVLDAAEAWADVLPVGWYPPELGALTDAVRAWREYDGG